MDTISLTLPCAPSVVQADSHTLCTHPPPLPTLPASARLRFAGGHDQRHASSPDGSPTARSPAREVARVAARRSGRAEAQISVSSARQRLELAITKADFLLAGHSQESWSRDGSDWLGMLRELCAEIVDAARDYLYAAQSAEGPQATDRGCEPLSEHSQADANAACGK